jgi:phosphoribosylglycinamide formyltransferase 1
MKSHRWAVFISGTGSNLQALLDRFHEPIPLKVYSSKLKAPGVGKARRMGIPIEILKSPIDWNLVHSDLVRHRIKKIFLLGFMKIIPSEFIDQWKGKILNLHPSLLPLYPGLNSFDRAWDDKAALGASVHEVIAELDAGHVLRQRKLNRSEDKQWDRLKLSWAEQYLVREVFDYDNL